MTRSLGTKVLAFNRLRLQGMENRENQETQWTDSLKLIQKCNLLITELKDLFVVVFFSFQNSGVTAAILNIPLPLVTGASWVHQF